MCSCLALAGWGFAPRPKSRRDLGRIRTYAPRSGPSLERGALARRYVVRILGHLLRRCPRGSYGRGQAKLGRGRRTHVRVLSPYASRSQRPSDVARSSRKARAGPEGLLAFGEGPLGSAQWAVPAGRPNCRRQPGLATQAGPRRAPKGLALWGVPVRRTRWRSQDALGRAYGPSPKGPKGPFGRGYFKFITKCFAFRVNLKI